MHVLASHLHLAALVGEIARLARHLPLMTTAGRSVLSLVAVLAVLGPAMPALADTVLFRVNVGGPSLAALDAGPAWGEDSGSSPSPYVNFAEAGNWFGGTDAPMGAPHVSVPGYVPAALFDTERWDLADANNMKWEFPVANGSYQLRLLFAEGCNCAQFANGRKFDVTAEGQTLLDEYDIYATFGGFTPGAETFLVQVADGSLSVELPHGSANAPSLRGIEVIEVDASQTLQPSRTSIGFGNVFVDSTSSPQSVTLTHLGSGGDPSITISSVIVTGPFTCSLTPQVVLPGQVRNFNVTFTPTSLGAANGTVTITHSGSNSPIEIALDGTGVNVPPIGFGKSFLQDVVPSFPTSIQFGPDGRLYVAELTGTILALNVSRVQSNEYVASIAHIIDLVKNIPNHDDDGALNPGQTTRLVTGIYVAGTAANPVIYACSSDPRINVPGAPGLDTNSGILSRLTWNGATWVKLDLVRGLPRSKNDHASNGMALDTLTNTLYIAQGGNTNMGAPSNNFSFLPEYALSAAILSVDLDAIGESTYDLPTLDDEDRIGTSDLNDPFGGNLGKNQAILVPGGPVQVYSSGFRNPYDVILTANGRMYSVDNGPNSGWGGPPTGEGPGAGCNNVPNESGTASLNDNLHFITGPGYYAGHPNPTRASVANTFNASNPQSPVSSGNADECDYLEPGTDGSLASWPFSTNGLCEYTASNLGGALQGNLLTTNFNSEVQRIALSAPGDSATLVAALFSNVGNMPLDIIAQGDDGPFPGTIWVCNFGSGLIAVYEPSDYDGVIVNCTAADDEGLDEDGDGYSNADEIDNGTSPCSAGDTPADFDSDFVSDLNDDDDDNDTILDVDDAFAIDASNGATPLPVNYSWDAGNPGFGILGVGFTGMMADSLTAWHDQFDPVQMTAGGAAGKVTIDQVPPGDALGPQNDQRYAFQFGVAVDSTTGNFVARTRASQPYFDGAPPAAFQSQGFYLGDGHDDDYLKIAIARDGADPAIVVVHEVAGAPSTLSIPVPGLLNGTGVDLEFVVDPAAGTIQPRYAYDGGPLLDAGPAVVPTPGSRLYASVREASALAVGIIATSRGASPFTATWDYIDVVPTGTVDVPPSSGRPAVLRLSPARPNPARGAVALEFALPRADRARVSIFDVRGARIRTLADREFEPGVHALRWDGRDEHGQPAANGVYFARVESGGRTDARRFVMLR